MAYDWTIDQIVRFGNEFRRLLPTGHLAILHTTGHIPVGNGPEDYAIGGVMSNFDVILSEYDSNLSQDSCWQVNGRLEAGYVRPHDQPAGDDPSPPFYLSSWSARGPYFHCAFEWDEYRWVRGQVSVADVQKGREYLKAQGCKWTG